MNYTASFLTFVEKKIFDELDLPILTIKYTPEVYPYKYFPPTITYNSLEIQEKEIEPIYKILNTIKEVEAAGLELISVAISKDMAWITKSQRSMFALKRRGSIPGPTEKKIIVMPAHQDACKVQLDEANLKVRLVSRKAGPNGVGPWISLRE